MPTIIVIVVDFTILLPVSCRRKAIKFDLQAILVGGLCPGAEDPAECEAALPGFWAGIAAILWPGYWDPTVSPELRQKLMIHVVNKFSTQAEWMCADTCAAPEDTVMTCDDCTMGIQASKQSFGDKILI